MTPVALLLVVGAAVLGLFTGSFLNVVVDRIPARLSLRESSRCPHGDEPARAWARVPVVSWVALRGRCASCARAISARYPIVEAVTSGAFALITWWFLSGLGPSTMRGLALAPVIIAYLYFAAISIVLTLIDVATHRLPNAVVLPGYLVASALFTIAAALSGEWATLLRAMIGMAAMYVFYFILRTSRAGGMGGGDVKLAGVVGIFLGWLGWATLAVGAFAAFALGGVFGIVLLMTRRAGRKTAIPFGPWILIGAWVGVFTGVTVGEWYVAMLVGG